MIFIFFVQKCIETLEAEDDDTQVQGGAENCMQLLERDADVRQPFRQGWKWSRIFPGGNFRPKQSRFTGEEKVLEGFQQILQ